MINAVMRKCRESIEVKEQFFCEQASQITKLCRAMAEAFQGGHRLFIMGNGGSAVISGAMRAMLWGSVWMCGLP